MTLRPIKKQIHSKGLSETIPIFSEVMIIPKGSGGGGRASRSGGGGPATSIDQLDKYVGSKSGIGAGYRPGSEKGMKLAVNRDEAGNITGHRHIPQDSTMGDKNTVYAPAKASDKAQVAALREALKIKGKSKYE